jgi:hypothetical protein
MTARIQNAGVQHLFKAIYAGGVPPQTLSWYTCARARSTAAAPASTPG